MGIKAIDHITINIKNLEKSLEFYGNVLELNALPVIKTKEQDVYYFELPGNTRLELIHYHGQISESEDSSLALGSCRHFAFEVDDIKETEQRIKNAGYTFHLPIAYTDTYGCTAGLMCDPNGFELEFLERPGVKE